MTDCHDKQPAAVTTGIITVTPATYARAAISRLAGRWWWVAVVPMAALAIGSAWNIACLFAAMIWLLMLLPPAVMIAYYSYLLKPQASAMAHPHRITFNPDASLTIIFEPGDNSGKALTDINLPHGNLYSVAEKRDRLVLNYRNSAIDLLIIPYSSIPPDEISHAIDIIYSE